MTRDQFGAWVLIYAAFLVPLVWLAAAEVRAAWRQTQRDRLDDVIRGMCGCDRCAAMRRHPSSQGRKPRHAELDYTERNGVITWKDRL